MSAASERSTSDEEHHAIHHAQAQSERDKECVARPQERKFLGFSFTDGPEVKRAIAPKALDRFKRRVREITRRAKGVSIETTMEELVPYMRAGAAISASAKPLASSCRLPAGSACDFAWLSGDSGKHHVVVGQLCWHWEYIQG